MPSCLNHSKLRIKTEILFHEAAPIRHLASVCKSTVYKKLSIRILLGEGDAENIRPLSSGIHCSLADQLNT